MIRGIHRAQLSCAHASTLAPQDVDSMERRSQVHLQDRQLAAFEGWIAL